MKNYYKIMGLKFEAAEDEVKRAYRALAKRYHPDIHPDDAEMAAKFADVNEANETLSDKAKRKLYDADYVNAIIAKQQAAYNNPNAGYSGGYQNAQHQNAQHQNANYYQNQFQGQNTYAQAQAQAQSMSNQAYQKGYSVGFGDAQKRAAVENAELKNASAAYAARAKAAEENLRKAQAQFIERGAAVATGAKTTEAEAANLRATVARLKESLERESDSRTFAEAMNEQLKDDLAEARKDADEARAQLAEWESYGHAEEEAANLRYTVSQWSNKVKDDKKWLKSTNYGALGVMFWATAPSINEAFEKLKKSYAKKVLAGDEKVKAKLKAAAEAYKILSDPKLRAAYNEELDITDAEIEECRAGEKEYKIALDLLKERDENEEAAILIDDLTQEAEAGNGEAANTLGEMYFVGTGTEKNAEEAVRWFNLSREQGCADGMYNLGLCYLNGDGIKPDAEEGVNLIKQAAKQGSQLAIEFEKNIG